MDSHGPKEAQAQSYSPGGANVPLWEAHWRYLVNTIEPSCAVVMRPKCQISLTLIIIVIMLIVNINNDEG